MNLAHVYTYNVRRALDLLWSHNFKRRHHGNHSLTHSPEQSRELPSNESQEQGHPQTGGHQIEQCRLGCLEEMHDENGGAKAKDVRQEASDEVHAWAAGVVAV